MEHIDKVTRLDFSGSLDELANHLCGLRYDDLHLFFEAMENRFLADARADEDRERSLLSRHLTRAFMGVHLANQSMLFAWDVCKHHMDEE